ncbi:MAG: hypothetical protein JRH20_17600 [Deltaproteobacteria bacterium]|nr:hypothetical protein [Deltaproteobacteria bacterium]
MQGRIARHSSIVATIIVFSLMGCQRSWDDDGDRNPVVLSGAVDAALSEAGAPLLIDPEGAGTPLEICDGFDNDLDGEVDEGLDDLPCEVPGKKGTGLTECVAGVFSCKLCTPGEERMVSCGCDEERKDHCLSDGTWMEGVCSGCPEKKVPCTGCVPGEQIVRRCDGCPEGEDCGAACIGSTWECTEGCEWEQITNCKPMTPTCSGDMSVLEPCGNCGVRRKACDGCFWSSELCMDQGSCAPGDRLTTPCFDKGCAEGTYSSATCDKECKWVKPKDCSGCKPGVRTYTRNCVSGNAQCGQMLIEETCTVYSEIKICEGERTLPVARITTKYLERCPYNLCVPGKSQTGPCVTSSGESGIQTLTCTKDCSWGPPTECDPGGTTCPTSQQCEANEVDKDTKSCGKNTCGQEYEETRTCRSTGCGWSVTTTQYTACPDCAVGETNKIYCKTSAGECGYITVKCDDTCHWDSSPTPGTTSDKCVATTNSCVPGSSKTDYSSCGTNTCGKTYPRKYTCSSTGCGWQFVSEDRSVCPTCTPGETEMTEELCKPGFPGCGTIQRKCNADTCQWQTLPCAVCG